MVKPFEHYTNFYLVRTLASGKNHSALIAYCV